MNKNESKYFKTASLMNQAFLEILDKKDFEYISVKEICVKAGVNRSTFYLHYETMKDLLNECLENANNAFNHSFSSSQKDFVSNIKDAPLENLVLVNQTYLIPYLEYVKNNKLLYKAAYSNRECLDFEHRMNIMSEKVLCPILTRFKIPKEEQKFWIKFYIQGCHAIIKEWILQDCKLPIAQIEKILLQCIRPRLWVNVEDGKNC